MYCMKHADHTRRQADLLASDQTLILLFVPGIGHAYPDRRGICLTFCGTFSKHTCPQGYECRSNGCGHECYRPMNFQAPASK